MTIATLSTLIACLCANAGNFMDKRECADPYVNCAIGDNGKILSKDDFIQKCTISLHMKKGLVIPTQYPALIKRCADESTY